MILLIEVGTSRTRIKVVKRAGNIVGERVIDVGMRDVAIKGTNNVMKKSINSSVTDLLGELNVRLEKIESAVSHGLITSDLGLVRIEHVPSPAGIEEIASHTVTKVFSDMLKIPITFIPGVKNAVGDITIKNINKADFMRGEETQIIGILNMPELMEKIVLPFYFLMLSSFTKIVCVNENEKISRATTSVTGQLFPAIMKETFLAGMLPKDFLSISELDKAMIIQGALYAKRFGFTRSLMLIRLMQYFLETSRNKAMNFLEGILAYIDLSNMEDFIYTNMNCKNIIIAGDDFRRDVYKIIIQDVLKLNFNIVMIEDATMKRATVRGAVSILEHARKLNGREKENN